MNFDSSIFRVGGYLGYNWQFTPQWLVGLEGDLAWGDSSKTSAASRALLVEPQAMALLHLQQRVLIVHGSKRIGMQASGLVWVSSLLQRGWSTRLVVLHSRTLRSEQAAPAPVRLGVVQLVTSRISSVKTGWTIGGGVEAVVWQNWLARVEYRYSDYGSIDHTSSASHLRLMKS